MSKQIRFWWAVLTALVTMTALSVFFANPSQAINPKINISPTSFTLSEFASTQISATLAEPILCAPDPSLPCSVILNFATSIPLGVSLSNSSIEWTQTEWAQTKTFTVTMTNPSLFQNNAVFHLVAVANSRSEYYSRFSVDLAVTVAVTQTTTSILSTTTTTPLTPSTTTTTLSTTTTTSLTPSTTTSLTPSTTTTTLSTTTTTSLTPSTTTTTLSTTTTTSLTPSTTTSLTPSTTTSLAARTAANQNLDKIPATGQDLRVALYAIWVLVFGVALTFRRKIRQQ